MITARQLRNRVLMILDRDDTMEPINVTEDDAITYDSLLPAIRLTMGGQTFEIVFREVDKRAVQRP